VKINVMKLGEKLKNGFENQKKQELTEKLNLKN